MNKTISIITVVFNNPAGLEKTLQSIVIQTYKNVELIIIDGGSTDGTCGIIKKFEGVVDYWISEPDHGPYDGMNKGLAKASGKWFIFMNAGDIFAGDRVLARVFSKVPVGADVIFGDWIADYKEFNVYRSASKPDCIWKGMICSHQSILIRTSLIKPEGFNLSNPIGADYDMIYLLMNAGASFFYYPEPIAKTEAYGISHRNMLKSAKEHFHILKTHEKINFYQRFFHYRFLVFVIFIVLIYKVLPRRIVLLMIRYINRNMVV